MDHECLQASHSARDEQCDGSRSRDHLAHVCDKENPQVEIDESNTNSEEEPPECTGRKGDAVRHTQEPGHPQNPAYSHDEQNDQSSNDSLTSTSPREVEDLDNTSRPTTRLNHNLTFKEATTWIDNFYGWLERNKRVLDSRSLEQQRILLEDSLDVNMLSKLQREGVAATEVRDTCSRT